MLNKIKFTYKEADKQEGLFTPSHTLFKCKIKVDGLQYTFNYQCNVAYNEPNLVDCLSSLIIDMDAYDNSDNFQDFCNNFGYDSFEDLQKAKKAYKACKKTSKALTRLFTRAEFEEINKELEEEGLF